MRVSASRAIIPLCLGGLLGFIAGYFAADSPAEAHTTLVATSLRPSTSLKTRPATKAPGDEKRFKETGDAHFDAQEWKAAAEAYERAVLSSPDDLDILSDLAVAYRNLGDAEKAIKLLEKVRARAPDRWQASLNLALIYAFDKEDANAAEKNLFDLERSGKSIAQAPLIRGQIAKLRKGHKVNGHKADASTARRKD